MIRTKLINPRIAAALAVLMLALSEVSTARAAAGRQPF